MKNKMFLNMTPEERLEAIKAEFRKSLGPDGKETKIFLGDATKAKVSKRNEHRADDQPDDEPASMGIEGHGAVFDSESDGLYFVEVIASGAFDDVLDDDVVGLFNHDANEVLGRTGAKTMRLSVDDVGLFYDIDVNEEDSQAVSTHAKVKRGDVTGSSFSFIVGEDTWEYSDDGETVKRTINKFARLYDVGPVTFPAYPSSTTSARNMKAAIAEAAKAPEQVPDWQHDLTERKVQLAENLERH